ALLPTSPLRSRSAQIRPNSPQKRGVIEAAYMIAIAGSACRTLRLLTGGKEHERTSPHVAGHGSRNLVTGRRPDGHELPLRRLRARDGRDAAEPGSGGLA